MIDLRATTEQKALIYRAAAAIGRNRSEFMLDAACHDAKTVLLGRRFSLLRESQFNCFRKSIEKPGGSNAKLRRLFEAAPS